LSIYADTSFVASLYLSDRHSAEAQLLIASKPLLWLTPLHRAEWTHAVERHVFQAQLSLREAQRVYADFESDVSTGVWLQVSLPDQVWDVCDRLARRYVARFGARTLDTLHVASALELKAERFWTFNERQLQLARAAGLNTG
jgi:predicted nucleic acid-binding protein